MMQIESVAMVQRSAAILHSVESNINAISGFNEMHLLFPV